MEPQLTYQQRTRQATMPSIIPMPMFTATPEPTEDHTPDNVEILATSDEEAIIMAERAKADGTTVRGTQVWRGPVPAIGSYEDLGCNMRMATAEFFFYRKANQLPFAQAVMLGMELCGHYRTHLTGYDTPENAFDYLPQPRTSTRILATYLDQVADTPEGRRALEVLDVITDGATSPITGWLVALLCSPVRHGGYGLELPMTGAVYDDERGLKPTADGEYLAYDLCWPGQRAVVQYVGADDADTRALEALCADTFTVLTITDRQLRGHRAAETCDAITRLLGVESPAGHESWAYPFDTWAGKRDEIASLRPRYEGMRATVADIAMHL